MSFTWLMEEDELNTHVVRKKPVGLKTFAEAKKVGAKAEAILAANRSEGHSKIEVTRGHLKVDAFVYLNDEAGDRAAAAIEFGHINPKTGKYIPGIAPLRKAAFG